MRCHRSMEGRLISKRNLPRQKTGKTSVNEAVTACSKMRPCAGQSANVPRNLKAAQITGPSVRLRRIVVFRFADIAVPIAGSTMGSNTKVLCQWERRGGVKRGIGKVEAPIRWKVDCRYLLNTHTDGLDTSDLLLPGHHWPFLVQLNTNGTFLDDVLTADGI